MALAKAKHTEQTYNNNKFRCKSPRMPLVLQLRRIILAQAGHVFSPPMLRLALEEK